MTLKSEQELKTDFSPGVFREHSAEKMNNFINSVFSVGGAMSVDDYSIAVTTNWAPFTEFDTSKDTKGINETLAEGKFTIEPGGEGKFLVIVSMVAVAPVPCWVQTAIFRNTNIWQKHKRTFINAGDEKVFTFFGGGNANVGDDIQYGIKADQAVTITGESCQMAVLRT